MKINRNNKNKRVNNKSLQQSKFGQTVKKIIIGGVIATVILTSVNGLTDLKENKEIPDREPISITQISDEKIKIDKVDYSIEYTTLETTEGLTMPSGTTELNLTSNLLHNLDGIENPEVIESLDITYNSVDSIDFSKFPNLTYIRLLGNYNLYNYDLLNYCKEHGIGLDIDETDVEYMEKIRETVKSLNIEGKSDLEKERTIYKYVLDHMKYDFSAMLNKNLVEEYNYEALKWALEGKGVCANYSTLFDAMCKTAGLNCFEIHGFIPGRHAWNIIEINGEYLMVDTTNCDNILGRLCYSIDELIGRNFYSKFNARDLDTLFHNYREFAGYNKKGKELKTNDKEELVNKSVKINREESIANDFKEESGINAAREKFKEEAKETAEDMLHTTGEFIEDIVSKGKEKILSIDYGSEEAKEIYKYLIIAILGGSAILLGKKEVEKLKAAKASGKIKEEKVTPKKLNKGVMEELREEEEERIEQAVEGGFIKPEDVIATKQEEFSEEVIEDIEKPEESSVEKTEEEIDYVKTLEEKVAYLIDIEKQTLRNQYTYGKTLESELAYYYGTIHMTREERAISSLIRDGYFKEETTLENMLPYQRDSFFAQMRLESEISKCIEMLLESGYDFPDISKSIAS